MYYLSHCMLVQETAKWPLRRSSSQATPVLQKRWKTSSQSWNQKIKLIWANVFKTTS